MPSDRIVDILRAAFAFSVIISFFIAYKTGVFDLRIFLSYLVSERLLPGDSDPESPIWLLVRDIGK